MEVFTDSNTRDHRDYGARVDNAGDATGVGEGMPPWGPADEEDVHPQMCLYDFYGAFSMLQRSGGGEKYQKTENWDY